MLTYSQIFAFSKTAFRNIFERNIPVFKKSSLILVKHPDIRMKSKISILIVPQLSVYILRNLLGAEISYL